MKKLLLSFGLALLGTSSFSQALFIVEEPAGVAGSKTFTTTNAWAADLSNPANSVHDTLMLVAPPDSLACNALTAGSLTGKIALLYRGTCNFSVKALNAQNAGAVAVVVVNNVATAPITMASGTGGDQVTIPVIMISQSDGAALRAALDNGDDVVGYIGTAIGYYPDNLAVEKNKFLRPDFGSLPAILAMNGTELSVPFGGWVYNYGADDQSAVTLNVTVMRGATEVYNQTSAAATIDSGDSLFIGLPNMALATYPAGDYTFTYLASLGGADATPNDNTYVGNFSLSDSLFSLARLDPTRVVAVDNSYSFGLTSDLMACIAFNDANADRLYAHGMYFGGITAATPKTVLGLELEATFYQWDDVFTNVDDATFNALNPIEIMTYTYTATTGDDSTIYFPFSDPLELASNQNYLMCVKEKLNPDSLYFAFSDNEVYGQNGDTLKGLYTILAVGTTYYRAGAASGICPSIALKTSVNDAGIKEDVAVDATSYPNPANDVITVLVNASGDAALTVTDLAGRTVLSENVKITEGQFKTNVSAMNPGTYMFSLDYENGMKSLFKVVVTR